MHLRLTIRTKLFLTILIILLISYSILIRTTYRSIDASLEDRLTKELSENLMYARDQYFARAEQAKYSLENPAAAPPVKRHLAGGDRPWLEEAVGRWRSVLPYLEMLLVVDARQRIVAGGNPEGHGDSSELAPIITRCFREKRPVLATELVSSRFLCCEGGVKYSKCAAAEAADGVMMITVAVPVLADDGSILGALVAGDVVDNDSRVPQRIQEVFGKQVIVVVTRKGELVTGSFGSKIPYPSVIDPTVVGQLERGISYRGDTAIGNKVYKTVFDPITDSRGRFVGSLSVALSRDDFNVVLRDSLKNIMASAAISLVLSFILAYLVARRLTRPINELATGVRMIESGDLRQRVAVDTSDEVGLLADAFNRMAKSLEERDRTIRSKAHDLEGLNEQLQEMNELLEQRVSERTADLQMEMERLEAILTGMAEGVAVTDRTGRIILFNPAAQKMFEMVPHRVVGHSIEEVCNKGEFCRLVEYLSIMRDNDKVASLRDVEMQAKGKKLKVNLSPFTDAEGSFAGVVMSIRDVTAEEEIDRMKTEFISTVSHELKTPLTSIKGSLQFILDKGKASAGVEDELLHICLRNTDRLIRLVNDILDIAKIESGRMEFLFVPQDLHGLIAQSIEELEGFARDHHVTVVSHCNGDLPQVYGDHDRLVQVLTNLLSNAVKFSPPGTTVEVNASRNENYVAVSVADRGREIQWSDRSKLFKKFQQLDNSDRRQQGGTGLGLAICKEIVERHHGRIFYGEGLNGGNVFTFTVPVYEEPT